MIGNLITYEKRASDRNEMFSQGALEWATDGIVIDEMHVRDRPILRAVPFVVGNEVRVSQPFPNTTRGRDAVEGIKEKVYTGLSVKFHAEEVEWRGALRVVKRARLIRAGLVDIPSYTEATVEVRRRAGQVNGGMGLWLYQ